MAGSDDIKGLPGGAQQTSVTSTPVTIDLSALVGRKVLITSKDQNLLFCFSSDSGGSQVFATGNQAASASVLIAGDAPKGIGKVRRVSSKAPYLVVGTDTGSGTVKISVVSEKASGE